jgi:CRP/FNR family transcriptional regulator, cyclic AMP receptor protein
MNVSWDRPSTGDWAEVLAGFPLFSGVSRRRLRKLVRNARFAEFAPGDHVISGRDGANSLYVVLGGAAKALAKPAARPLAAGDYFGELALIDGAPRSATIIATEELHVMQLPRESLLQLARRHPAVALTMLRSLSSQFRSLETRLARPA